MLAATIRPGEESVLAVEGNRPDSTFDDVGIDFDPAVINEPDEALPAAEAIADRFGKRALLRDGG